MLFFSAPWSGLPWAVGDGAPYFLGARQKMSNSSSRFNCIVIAHPCNVFSRTFVAFHGCRVFPAR
jgi:hypothetical protein